MKVLVCQFFGGEYDRKQLSLEEVEAISDGLNYAYSSGRFTREELMFKPTVPGYLGPMWDGERYFGIDGKWHYTFDHIERDASVENIGVLRYETQEVYNMLSK